MQKRRAKKIKKIKRQSNNKRGKGLLSEKANVKSYISGGKRKFVF